MPDIVNPISPPQFAGAPYADAMEVTGPPVLQIIPEEYGPFLRTDARTVMITVRPHHLNFIPNPAFREDTAGWTLSGDVWGGQDPDYGLVAEADGAVNQTDLEAILALPAPDGSTILVEYEGASQTLLVGSTETLAVAEAKFPLAGDVTGCRAFLPLTDALDVASSWVGQSLALSGEGVLRYQDQDKEGGQAFVYVGPSQEPEGEWFEYARGSAQWTFSAYVRGRGKARLVMESYLGDGYKGPVLGVDIPVVANPGDQPFDKNVPEYIEEGTGALYRLRPAPYYNQLWRPIVVPDPASLPSQDHPVVLDSNGDLWWSITPPPATGPLYENVGKPTVVDHMPLTDDPGDPFLIVQEDPPNPSTDGFVWRVNGPPYYERTETPVNATAIGSTFGPWIEIGAEDAPEEEWTRLLLQTSARTGEGGVSFDGCYWIDARLEFEDANGLWISSLMLDPTEHPVAPYFDGGMIENADQDDFFWSEEAEPNNSISYYYRDRVARLRWLEQNMRFLVPVARPVQFFYNDWSRPHTNQITQQSSAIPTSTFTI